MTGTRPHVTNCHGFRRQKSTTEHTGKIVPQPDSPGCHDLELTLWWVGRGGENLGFRIRREHHPWISIAF
jgi:hypothetical protein